jgi:peptidoglycan/xylan/chitin deacetylase (PgdA/CDA1 family)
VGVPHRQLEEGEEHYWITEDSFIGILDLVADRNDVSLSFDDGNQSDIEIGLPALVERGLAAEFFPVASRLDCPGSLGGEDLRRLVAGGMSVGTHGMRHQSWRGIRGRDLEEELDTARSVLAAVIGRDVLTAACPLGAYDRRLLGELRERGYVRVLTSDRTLANPDSWLQPRFSVRAADDLQSIRLLLTCRRSALARARTRARIFAKSWR